jgi:hypothetical protein
MKKNKLAFKLIDMGLKAETLANLTESQLRLLYKKLNEQVTPAGNVTKQTKQVTTYNVPPGSETEVPTGGKNVVVSTKGGKTAITPMESEMKEGKKTKSKKYNPWAICSSSVGREDKEKYERCVMDVKKSIKEGKDPINLFLEEKIVSLIEKHVQPKISKKEFINMISETETAPAKPKEKEKTEKGKPKTPFSPKPGVKPAPKAKKETNEAETAEPIVKPKTPTTKPKTPFSPKPGVKPAPKAGKKSVPSWLKWDNFGLKF